MVLASTEVFLMLNGRLKHWITVKPRYKQRGLKKSERGKKTLVQQGNLTSFKIQDAESIGKQHIWLTSVI